MSAGTSGEPQVVLASSNPGKLREIRAILNDLPVAWLGLDAFPDVRLPEEGDDYAANAMAKARAAARQVGLLALGDDSGLEVEGLGEEPLRGVFIRAPAIETHGDGVEVLAAHEGRPVVVRQGQVLACAFHPELTDDSRLHALFMAMATRGREERAAEGDPRLSGQER